MINVWVPGAAFSEIFERTSYITFYPSWDKDQIFALRIFEFQHISAYFPNLNNLNIEYFTIILANIRNMQLSDLPLEILRKIISETVSILYGDELIRLQLVNSTASNYQLRWDNMLI